MKPNLKKLLILLWMFLTLLMVAILLYGAYSMYNKHKLEKCNADAFCRFDTISKNAPVKDEIGRNLANLSFAEEKEIQEVIKKAYEGRWKYYYDKDENKLDQSMDSLCLPEKYQCFKKEIKEESKERERYGRSENTTLGYRVSSIKDLRFSKSRGYRDFDNRIGIIAGSYSLDFYYFLFKKTDNQWKIEKVIKPIDISKLTRIDLLPIQELLEQKNNKTPEARIAEYLEAIQQNDKIKALEVWQLLEEDENRKTDPNYVLLEKRRIDLTEELIAKKIKSFEIVDTEWRDVRFYYEDSYGKFDIVIGNIIEGCYSYVAEGARVQVQLTDSDNDKFIYIFDIFVREVTPGTIKDSSFFWKHWTVRDVYLENEEPLFWMTEDEML